MDDEYAKRAEALGYQLIVWPPKEWDPILREIGRIVFSWNVIENAITNILNLLFGGEHRAIIVTAHMGITLKLDALRTLAAEFLTGDEQEHVFHSIDLFERLRERRNFYVHGFTSITQKLAGVEQDAGQLKFLWTDFGAALGSWSAKNRLKRHELSLTAADLGREASVFHAATEYYARVHNHFRYPDKAEYQSLPEKFPIPGRLTKPARFVLDE